MHICVSNNAYTHLKLALSIHIQPSFTTHRISSCGMSGSVPFGAKEVELDGRCTGVVELAAEQGIVRSGSRYPLSLRKKRECEWPGRRKGCVELTYRANCSKHIGRNSVKETTTKTSLRSASV